MKQGKRLILFIGIGAVIVLLASFTTIINFVTDYQWFQELGYEQVFLTKLMTQLRIGLPFFVVLTLLIHFYFLWIKKDYYKKVNFTIVPANEKGINRLSLLAAAVVSFLTSLTFTGSLWFELLRFFNATEFSILDPVFQRDISFYMFQLPLIQRIYYMLISFLALMAILTFIYYMILLSVRHQKGFEETDELDARRTHRGIHLDNGKKLLEIATRQVMLLGIVFLLILGFGYVLRTYELLYSPRGVAYGASFTDVHITLWVYRGMTALAIVSAVLWARGIKKGNMKQALTGPILMILLGIAGNGVALMVQNFIVAPDEISKERTYIDYNIQYTKAAYGLNDIDIRDFPAEDNLTREDLEKNKETIRNIRIHDYRPTNQFYNQREGIRQYYLFNDVDIDRYEIGGQYTQVFLSAREMNSQKVSEQWINQHLKYTHGYGAALSPVNTITREGQPQLLIRNVPPQSEVPELEITRPEIYFGELTNNYIITNTKEKEFDYPLGEQNAETLYEGTAGIRLGGFNKLLYAIRQGSLKMLLSGNITGESRIHLHRNINDRVRRIAPFIEYDEDPYLVISEGRLFWIIDGYTVSENYPYAQPYVGQRGNYIRNSVKVVIDAYNGTTDYYIADEQDPVIQTFGKIFPQLLKPMAQMPEGLRAHIRYPQSVFDIQSEVYRIYHMTDTDVFYTKEDLWDIANEMYERKQQVMESHYNILKLPGETREEFILSIPYTPRNKPNMTALFMARSDGEHYGELVLYRLPKQKNVYGPMQVESKIDQDTEISKEFSLWGQQGSSYIRGNLLTIPIENSLLYVEPIYLRADNESSLPEVKRVIVFYGERIAYEETLEAALEKLFGTAAEVPSGEAPDPQLPTGEASGNIPQLIRQAKDVFNRAQEAQRGGNWAEYGRLIEELRGILEGLDQSQQ
ncbi:MAG: UPF0182 family protein [Thermotaleaceae bacterium]